MTARAPMSAITFPHPVTHEPGEDCGISPCPGHVYMIDVDELGRPGNEKALARWLSVDPSTDPGDELHIRRACLAQAYEDPAGAWGLAQEAIDRALSPKVGRLTPETISIWVLVFVPHPEETWRPGTIALAWLEAVASVEGIDVS